MTTYNQYMERVQELIAGLLLPRDGPLTFNDMFGEIFEALAREGFVTGGEEMARLRVYERLQMMVSSELIQKDAHNQYWKTDKLKAEFPEVEGIDVGRDEDYISMAEYETLRRLRNRGFAVIVWAPFELDGASPSKVCDRSIELGWDVINDLK